MVARSLHDGVPVLASGTALPQPRPVDTFALTDQDGNRFDNASLDGLPSLAFFGFTRCRMSAQPRWHSWPSCIVIRH